jgi:YbbR domain-containing protein
MKLYPRHPVTLALAVVLACLLWYATALDRREKISERQLDTPLTLVNVPADMVITSDVPRLLSLRVRGPLSRLRSLEPAQTGVVLDLRGVGEGTHPLAVGSRDVVVPAGVEVLVISPGEVSLRLEKVVQRSVPVRPHVLGIAAAGLVVSSVMVDPPAVVVSGPRLQLAALVAVSTDPVSIDGAEGPVESMVSVRAPSPLARVVAPVAVRVIVQLTAARVDQRPGRRR